MFSYLWGVGNCEGGEEGWRGVIAKAGRDGGVRQCMGGWRDEAVYGGIKG